jgi:hypothetical protein
MTNQILVKKTIKMVKKKKKKIDLFEKKKTFTMGVYYLD